MRLLPSSLLARLRHRRPLALVWVLALCLPLLQQLGVWHTLEHELPASLRPAQVADGGLFGAVDGDQLHDCLQFDGAAKAVFLSTAWVLPAWAPLPPQQRPPPVYRAPWLAVRRVFDGRAPPLLLS